MIRLLLMESNFTKIQIIPNRKKFMTQIGLLLMEMMIVLPPKRVKKKKSKKKEMSLQLLMNSDPLEFLLETNFILFLIN